MYICKTSVLPKDEKFISPTAEAPIDLQDFRWHYFTEAPLITEVSSMNFTVVWPIIKIIQLVEKIGSKKIDEDETSKPEVLQFCRKHGLMKYLSDAIKLIENCFLSIQEFHIEVEKDPETEEEWLTLAVTIQGEVDKVLKDYNGYISLFVSKVPWPERDKIRLSYNIV